MDGILENTLVIGLFAGSLRMATPLVLGTMGELYNEKSGVLNLGIEGTMLFAALVAFLAVRATDNLWLGVLAAGVSGGLLSIAFAFFTVTLGLDQLVAGLGFTFFSTGLSFFLYRFFEGNPTVLPTIKPFSEIVVPVVHKIPFVGPVLFKQYALVYIAFAVAVFSTFVLYKTSWGIKIRTVGENPTSADTVGINVAQVRYWSLIWGGFLIGIGGAFLSLAQSNIFTFGQISGRGWICLALVIFGGWRPGRCLLGAILFGGIDALQFRLQTMGFDIPHQFFLMLPYLMTIIVLILVSSRRALSPAALLIPYRRE